MSIEALETLLVNIGVVFCRMEGARALASKLSLRILEEVSEGLDGEDSITALLHMLVDQLPLLEEFEITIEHAHECYHCESDAHGGRCSCPTESLKRNLTAWQWKREYGKFLHLTAAPSRLEVCIEDSRPLDHIRDVILYRGQ